MMSVHKSSPLKFKSYKKVTKSQNILQQCCHEWDMTKMLPVSTMQILKKYYHGPKKVKKGSFWCLELKKAAIDFTKLDWPQEVWMVCLLFDT